MIVIYGLKIYSVMVLQLNLNEKQLRNQGLSGWPKLLNYFLCPVRDNEVCFYLMPTQMTA